MTNYTKSFLLVIGGILFTLISKGQDLVVPRPVVEWCIECDTKFHILMKLSLQKDSIINDAFSIIDRKNDQLTSYKKDSITFKAHIASLDTINTGMSTQVDLLTKENKRLVKQRNGERIGGILVILGLLVLFL